MAIGVLCALFAGVFRYVDQHFHSPETFLENNLALADNADIRERLFDGFRGEIIRLADGEDAEIEEDELSDLADLLNPDGADDAEDGEGVILDPVTQERNLRDQAIEEILLDVFESDTYDDVFLTALESTQSQIVRAADLEDADLLRDKGEINFDMRELYRVIYPQLAANERTAEITQSEVPSDYGIFSVGDRETTINALWSGIRNGPSWRTLTFAGAIVALIGAVVVAERRPSTAIQFGAGMVGVAVVVIVIAYIIRAIVPLLAGGGSSAGPVVATYASNIWPLISIMIRVAIFGTVLALGGWVARLIWPDDWVYSHVADDSGVRSIKRRRGESAPAQQQQPAAAAVPVGYPGYAQPYPGYGPGYAQPYPGQPYPPQQPYPPVPYGYPAGPYAQQAPPVPQYTATGRPTVPVTPVSVDSATAENPQAAPPALPADAAQVVPRIVADPDDGEPTEQAQRAVAGGDTGASHLEEVTGDADADKNDEWASEPDW